MTNLQAVQAFQVGALRSSLVHVVDMVDHGKSLPEIRAYAESASAECKALAEDEYAEDRPMKSGMSMVDVAMDIFGLKAEHRAEHADALRDARRDGP